MSTARDLSTPEMRGVLYRALYRDARANWGDGWEYLSIHQQRAELSLAALLHLDAQDDSIDPARIVQRVRVYAELVASHPNGQEANA